jgi:hypothetical protein
MDPSTFAADILPASPIDIVDDRALFEQNKPRLYCICKLYGNFGAIHQDGKIECSACHRRLKLDFVLVRSGLKNAPPPAPTRTTHTRTRNTVNLEMIYARLAEVEARLSEQQATALEQGRKLDQIITILLAPPAAAPRRNRRRPSQ